MRSGARASRARGVGWPPYVPAVRTPRSATSVPPRSGELLRDARDTIDVTVPGRTRRGTGDLTVHNVPRLHDYDRGCIDHIPLTSVARTLLDIAERVPPRRLARAVGEAERLFLFDLRPIDALCERSIGAAACGS